MSREYASLISATLETASGSLTLAATSMRSETHIVKFNDYWMDIVPNTPYLLFVDNRDQPGSIGAVGTIAGRHNINISFMGVGRIQLRGQANDGHRPRRPGAVARDGRDQGALPHQQREAGHSGGVMPFNPC